MPRVSAPRQRHTAILKAPTEQNLGCGPFVSACYGSDNQILQEPTVMEGTCCLDDDLKVVTERHCIIVGVPEIHLREDNVSIRML